MKRWLFITGIITIFILIGIWAYLLFFGAPTKEELFSILDFGDTTDETAIVDTPPPPEEPAPVLRPRLRQLTTRTVAGYGESETASSSSPLVYFAEAGTGHIYSIDVETGTETRLSNITIPGASTAVFSKDAKRVAIKSALGKSSTVAIVSFASSSDARSENLSGVVGDFSMSSDGSLLYSSSLGGLTQAKAYNFDANSSRVLFDIPFANARIDWGKSTKDPHYVYPKAASRLEGFLYRFVGGVMSRAPISGYGLTSLSTANYTIYATQANGTYQTYLYNYQTGVNLAQSLTFLPEKCTFLHSDLTAAICANSVTGVYDITIPDNWYQGVTSYADELWYIDLESGEATLVTETIIQTGRELDIINLQTNSNDERLYFINKNDQTFWIYELTE